MPPFARSMSSGPRRSFGPGEGFVVGKDNPGFSVKKIENKMALRVVQNGLITLKDCRCPRRTGCRTQHFQRHREGPEDDSHRRRVVRGGLRHGRL